MGRVISRSVSKLVLKPKSNLTIVERRVLVATKPISEYLWYSAMLEGKIVNTLMGYFG